MASEVAKQVTWQYVNVALGSFRRGSTSDMRGNGDSDCVLGRMGLQKALLLARQRHEYPARLLSCTEGNFAWVNKTGNVRIKIEERSCRHFLSWKSSKYYILRVFVSVALGIRHAMRIFSEPHYSVVCGLSSCTIVVLILIHVTVF
jgi:hypothetical protein